MSDPEGVAIIRCMTPEVHITEAELVRDVRAILQRLETGAEFVIERDAQPVAVLRSALPLRRRLSECISLLPDNSSATIDREFANDVEAAIAGHREPLEPSSWG